MGLLVLWFLWLVGETLIHHFLHPEAGRAKYLFPERAELIQGIYVLSRWVLALALGTAVVLWSFNSSYVQSQVPKVPRYPVRIQASLATTETSLKFPMIEDMIA